MVTTGMDLLPDFSTNIKANPLFFIHSTSTVIDHPKTNVL